jgi:hypothetical protein
VYNQNDKGKKYHEEFGTWCTACIFSRRNMGSRLATTARNSVAFSLSPFFNELDTAN